MDIGSFVIGVVIFWAIGIMAIVVLIAVAYLVKNI